MKRRRQRQTERLGMSHLVVSSYSAMVVMAVCLRSQRLPKQAEPPLRNVHGCWPATQAVHDTRPVNYHSELYCGRLGTLGSYVS
eukprot:47136-Pyramimonas_sp.AAC.1